MKTSVTLTLFFLFIGLGLTLAISLYWLQKLWQIKERRAVIRWKDDFSNLFIFFDSSLFFRLHCSISLLIPSLFFIVTRHFLSTLILGSLLILGPRCWLHLSKKKRRKSIDLQLPDTLMQISGSLRSGISFLNAIELISDNTTGAISQEFSVLVREYRMGTSIHQTLANLESRIATDNISLAVTTITIALETGGNLSESLERLSSSIRNKIMIEKKIDSLTSQGKLQGIVVGLLPIGIGAVLFKIEPQAMSSLFSTWIGYFTIFMIAIMETLGLMSIKKIVTIDV